MLSSVLDFPFVYALWQWPFIAQKFEPIVNCSEYKSAQRILDIACGPGINTKYFKGRNYLGIDLNQKYVDYARSKYGDFYKCHDAREIDATLGKFDLILMNSFLHHVSDQDTVNIINRAKMLLNPGGTIQIADITMPNENGIVKFLAKSDRGKYVRSAERLQTLVAECLNIKNQKSYSLNLFGINLWDMVYFNTQMLSA